MTFDPSRWIPIRRPVECDPAAQDRASQADRRWFEDHPGCTRRIRPALPGEFPGNPLVEVRRLDADTRLRRPIGMGAS